MLGRPENSINPMASITDKRAQPEIDHLTHVVFCAHVCSAWKAYPEMPELCTVGLPLDQQAPQQVQSCIDGKVQHALDQRPAHLRGPEQQKVPQFGVRLWYSTFPSPAM